MALYQSGNNHPRYTPPSFVSKNELIRFNSDQIQEIERFHKEISGIAKKMTIQQAAVLWIAQHSDEFRSKWYCK